MIAQIPFGLSLSKPSLLFCAREREDFDSDPLGASPNGGDRLIPNGKRRCHAA